jgi:hypothetical protein
VDAVAVKINGGTAVPLAREDGHPDPADTTWVGTVPGAKVGDKYRYAIQRGGVTASLNRPGGNVTGVSAMNVELTTARQPKTVGQVKSGQLLSPRIVELTRDEASSFRVPAGTKDDRKRRGFDRECRWHAARCDNNGDPAADHSTPGE